MPLQDQLAETAGFGNCGHCKFVEAGPASLCFACARRTMQALAPLDQRCEVCDQPFDEGWDRCGNSLCRRSDRQFKWNYAIAMKTGVLEQKILAYKYDGKRGWGMIFGRVLAGFLESNPKTFKQFDVITSSPTFVGAEHPFDHTREVVREADRWATQGMWPFDLQDPPVIVKGAATKRLAQLKTLTERREVLEGAFRQSLNVPDSSRVKDKAILVYDDVFTTGRTLNEVARALRAAGAKVVCGVSLARAPWR